MHHNKRPTGFTLIEVLVIAPIVLLFIGAFISSIIYLTGDTLYESGRVKTMDDLHVALDRVESDVKMSGAFLATNNMTVTTPQGFNNDTTAFTNNAATGTTLILNTFVTNANPLSPTRGLVNLANMPNACGTPNFGQNQVMTMNTVYFVKDNSLWRRTVAANDYASRACAGVTMWQRPSCAPGIAGTLCVTQDEKLLSATGSITLTVDYYDSPSDVTPIAAALTGSTTARQAALDTSRTVRVTIVVQSSAAGREYTQQGSMRISRIGSLVKYATP